MWRRALALLLVAAPVAAAPKGSIRGEVHITTVRPDGSRKVKEDLSNAVVYITDFQDDAPPPATPAKLSQRNKAFDPPVLPIQVGQTVQFINDDPLLHNVFTESRTAHFDLGQYKSPPKTWRFTQPDEVDVYCNIHEKMAGTILVLPNHSFARTGADGRFLLRDIPPGKHTVYAWLSHAERVSRELEVLPGREAVLTFELEEKPVCHPHPDKYGRSYKQHGGYQSGADRIQTCAEEEAAAKKQ